MMRPEFRVESLWLQRSSLRSKTKCAPQTRQKVARGQRRSPTAPGKEIKENLRAGGAPESRVDYSPVQTSVALTGLDYRFSRHQGRRASHLPLATVLPHLRCPTFSHLRCPYLYHPQPTNNHPQQCPVGYVPSAPSVLLISWTISTSAITFSTGVSGRMPWPRLKMCPGRPPACARISLACVRS